MRLYFLKNVDGSVSYCNWPITETMSKDGEQITVESILSEVNDEWLASVQDGTHDFDIQDGAVVLVESNRKAEKEAREVKIEADRQELELLKQKLASGNASASEIQLALSKLI